MQIRYFLLILFLPSFLCASTFEVSVDSTVYQDTIELRNGNLITCEILGLQKRILTIKTEYSDSDFNIEWDDVVTFSTVQKFTVFTKTDGRYFGPIKSTFRNDSIFSIQVVDEDRGIKELHVDELVYLKRIRKGFFQRAYAKIGVGYNWTKAQNIRQTNLFGDLRYTSDRHIFNGNFNYSKTIQDSVQDVFRTNGSISYEYLFANKLLILSREDFLQNSEQLVKLRASTSIGPGYIFLYNYYSRGVVATGTTWNNERFYGDEPRENSFEIFLTLDFIVFDWNDLDFSTTFNSYSNVSEWGRFRFDNVTSLSYDLPLVFFVGMDLSLNYDNKPAQDASKLDFVFNLNFGWEFDP